MNEIHAVNVLLYGVAIKILGEQIGHIDICPYFVNGNPIKTYCLLNPQKLCLEMSNLANPAALDDADRSV